MRNPDRIKLLLGLIEMFWIENPDMRLTQLILNVRRGDDISRFYNLEDVDLADRLWELYG